MLTKALRIGVNGKKGTFEMTTRLVKQFLVSFWSNQAHFERVDVKILWLSPNEAREDGKHHTQDADNDDRVGLAHIETVQQGANGDDVNHCKWEIGHCNPCLNRLLADVNLTCSDCERTDKMG